MPRTDLHPLLVYLLERGVTLKHGAALLGLNERTLRRWLSWKVVPSHGPAHVIARGLGYDDPEDLFPNLLD